MKKGDQTTDEFINESLKVILNGLRELEELMKEEEKKKVCQRSSKTEQLPRKQ